MRFIIDLVKQTPKKYLQIIILSILITVINSQICPQGFYKNNNSCQQCDLTCATCYSNTSCSTCYDQMYLTFRGKRVVCELCYILNTGCESCISSTRCRNCSNGYYLDERDTCQVCSHIFANCLLCTENGSYCLSCKRGYISFNSVCVNYIEVNSINNSSTMAEDQLNPSNELSFNNNDGFQNFGIFPQNQSINCILPCASCKLNQQNFCLSCINSYKMSQVQLGKCQTN